MPDAPERIDLDEIEARLKRFHSTDPKGPTGTAFTLLNYVKQLRGNVSELEQQLAQRRATAGGLQEQLDATNRVLASVEDRWDKADLELIQLRGEVARLKRRAEATEARLARARSGIENIAAQARLCIDHVGIPQHQKQWVRNEIANEERIALSQIEHGQEPEKYKLEAQRYRKLKAFRCECFNRVEWAALRSCTSFDFDDALDVLPDTEQPQAEERHAE